MTRLPPALQPLWPAAKRAHRAATRAVGSVTRGTGVGGDRAVPRVATRTSRESADREPADVRLHVGGPAERVRREHPVGTPSPMRFWDEVRVLDVPPRQVLEVTDGRLVGDYAATLTPGGVLDLETSPYFGIRDWHEHPLYLRARLPVEQHLPGTVVSLASPASGRNYYHSVMDALPRWGVLQEALPGTRPDHLVVAHTTRWDAELVALAGLDAFPLVHPAKHLHVRADRLLVPGLGNRGNLAPPWATQWLRRTLVPKDVHHKPRRLYVTRGDVPNTRRLVRERELLDLLEPRGFVRIDPGTLSVQEQIDHFAAAEVVVAPHGAALVNLVFAGEGVRVLELFAPAYVDPGYWSITSNVPGSTYRYLVGAPHEPDRPRRRMLGVGQDIDLDPAAILDALEELLSA